MKRAATGPIGAALLMGGAAANAQDGPFADAVAADYESHLEDLFVHFHQNPELSYLETDTAARMASELRAAGLTVTEGVGGTGVVGMLENGPGPLILLRADMDGLPVEEKTGLPYASQATQQGQDGEEYPVMHACGHDVHITSMVGTARQLAAMKDRWSGTLMFVVQPAEERVGGAVAMMEDGLYERFGKPDYAVAFHVTSLLPTGQLSASDGIMYSSADSVDIMVPGVGAQAPPRTWARTRSISHRRSSPTCNRSSAAKSARSRPRSSLSDRFTAGRSTTSFPIGPTCN
jgi:hippurate hydrolase